MYNHRATVSRQTWIDRDGSPMQIWSTVASAVPCLYTPSDRDNDVILNPTEQTESWASGTLFASARANIKPNDRLTMTRPPGVRLTVSAANSTVLGFDGVSHREFRVTTV